MRSSKREPGGDLKKHLMSRFQVPHARGLHTMKTKELKEKPRPDLLALAAQLKITGRHRMNKGELAAAIVKAAQKADAAKKKKPSAGPKIKAEPKRKKALTVKRTPVKIPVSKAAPQRGAIIDKQWQEDVERAKYELFAAPPALEAASRQELPHEYGETSITALVRDPHWAFAYWEIEPQRLRQAQQAIGDDAGAAQTVLRVYDITGIEFNGTNAHHYFDIIVNARTGSCYLNLEAADRTYCIDIGLRTATGAFQVLARSAAVHAPRARMSDVIDEQYAASREQSEKIYALSGGYGIDAGSLSLQEMAAQRLQEQVSSPGMSSRARAGAARKK